MATHKDLLEAQAFNRRRLVTAFVRGDPGGIEVEPPRPGRILLGGLVLTVAIVVGTAAVAFATGRPDPGWRDEGSFVVSEETGQQYVVLRRTSPGVGDAELHRVPNLLSAQLLLGDPDPAAHIVAERHLREVGQGSDLGIVGAPVGLPGPGDLLRSGWTACTDGDATRVTLAAEPAVRPLGRAAFLVRTGPEGPVWLLAPAGDAPEAARRFRLPADTTAVATLVDRLGFGTLEQAPVVDEAWLELFPQGPPLTKGRFGISGSGPAAYPSATPDLAGFRLGDQVRTPDGRSYLLADEGPQQLDEFAALVHAAVVSPPREVGSGIRAVFVEPGHPSDWPRTVPPAVRSEELCAVLETDGGKPRAVLAVDPRGSASAAGVAPGTRQVHVDPIGGAYVRSDDGNGGGPAFVIDARGRRHALRGDSVADHIGYGDTLVPEVPQAWLELFDEGVELSVDAALAGQ